MAGGDGDWGEVGLAAFPESEALPVEAGRRGGGTPAEHYIVEELVAGEDRRRVAVAVHPRPGLLEDPRQLAGGGVNQSVAECLRTGRLLFG
jgi:hypothetical protein